MGIFTRSEKIVVVFVIASFVVGAGMKYFLECGVKSSSTAFADTEKTYDAEKTECAGGGGAREYPQGSVPGTQKGGVNINTAGEKELCALPGIGPVLAGRIVKDREEGGVFRSKAELKRVKGIGDKKFERMEDMLLVE